MLKNYKSLILKYINSNQSFDLKTELTREWPDIHPEDKPAIYRFLCQAKEVDTFLKLCVIDLNQNTIFFSWIDFFYLLTQCKIKIPPTKILFFKNFLKRKKINFREETDVEIIFKNLLKNKHRIFLEKLENKKKDLLSSIEIAESERLFDKKKEYIKEIQLLFPKNKKFKNLSNKIESQNISKSLSKLKKTKSQKKLPNRIKITKEEEKFIESIYNQSKKYQKNTGKINSDLAIMFHGFESYRCSIEILSKSEDSETNDWHLLDLYLLTHQHISLLEHCDILKSKYSHNPNALFSIFYAESLGYWELGEKSKAIDLMSQISLMKPHFKSSTEILKGWKEEKF